MRRFHCSSAAAAAQLLESQIQSHLNALLASSNTSDKPNPAHATQIHGHLVTAGRFPVALLHTQLINLYARCGLLDHAILTFRCAQPYANVVAWTSVIAHVARSLRPLRAFLVFAQLLAARPAIRPNPHTFSAVLPACAASGSLPHGVQVHALAHRHGVAADVYVACALADMYAKCRDMGSSKRVFDEMTLRSLASWNALIVGFVGNELYDEAIEAFRRLLVEPSLGADQVSFSSVLSACANNGGLDFGRQVHGRAVKVGLESLGYVKNSLMDMYSKCGYFEGTMELFQNGSHRDVVTWNIMMMGCVQSDDFEDAYSCLRAMLTEGITPDEASFSTVLHASACLASCFHGASIHTLVTKTGYCNNLCIGSSLISMYSKCGSLEDAYRSFEETRCELHVVSWTAMIAAFQQHGHGEHVIKLFQQMLQEGIKPDYITFVSVLSACSHNGLIEQGFEFFDSMSQVHNLVPGHEHYACMVDMLCRAGRLDKAQEFISKMPIEPDASLWGSMLAACRNRGDLELGKVVAERLFHIEPENPGNYVLLSNMYACQGRLEEAKAIRKLMGSNGVKKNTGCSWIGIQNQTYVFTAHDLSHNKTEEIYAMLRRLEKLAKENGYVPDISFAVNDVGEYKEQNLWYHSERLALAFALISLSVDAPIQIKKNLRTCGDCHQVMKIFSGVLQRDIVLRDTNRFHRFADGSCSCQDYW